MSPFPWAATAMSVAWLLLLPDLLRASPGARRPALVACVAVLAGLVALAVVGPAGLPVHRLTLLSEGTESYVIAGLWSPHPWLARLVPDGVLPFRGAVWLDLGLALVSLVGMGVLAHARLGWLGGMCVTAAWGASPWFLHGAWSNGPAMPLVLCTLLAASALTLRAHATDRVRWHAAIVVMCATWAAAQLREESAVVGLVASVWALAGAADPAAERRVDGWLARLPTGVGFVLVVLATSHLLWAVQLAAPWLPDAPTMTPAAPWDPAQLQTLRLPLDLVAFLPLGVALLVMWGGVVACRRAVGLTVVLAGVLLARVVADVSHLGAAPLETLRYLGPMMGLFGVAALAGGAALADRLGARAWLLWAMVALSAVAPRPGAPEVVAASPWHPLHTTQTEGARWWVEVADRWPDCLLVTRMADRVVRDVGPQEAWTFAWVTAYAGDPVAPVVPLRSEAALVDALQARGVALSEESPDPRFPAAAGSAACALFVTGLDCHLPGADCEAFTDGLERLDARTVEAPEHNTHHGSHRSPLALAVHRIF